jgi:hypothetical protein
LIAFPVFDWVPMEHLIAAHTSLLLQGLRPSALPAPQTGKKSGKVKSAG